MNRCLVLKVISVALASIVLQSCATPTQTQSASASATPQTASSQATSSNTPFVSGIAVAPRWGAGSIPYAKGVGVSSVRVDAPWKLIEAQRGQYAVPNWLDQLVTASLQAGMQPLLILDYGNPFYSSDKPKTPDEVEAFKRYAVFVVNHFKGRVHTYELWNEWNSKTGGTTGSDAESYVAFASQIVPAIRAADPGVKVISQGVSPGGVRGGWLNHFFDIKGYKLFDGVALHPYSWPWKTDRNPEATIQFVDRLQAAAQASNGGKPIDFYITEMGWPTFKGDMGENREAAAAYLSRFMLLASCRTYIRGVWWYGLIDEGNDAADPEQNFGIYDSAKNEKPAAVALQKTTQVLSQGNGQCTVTQQNGAVTVQLKGAKSGGNGSTVLHWRGGDIAPGGAAWAQAPAEKALSVATPPAGTPLFTLPSNRSEGVPQLIDGRATQ